MPTYEKQICLEGDEWRVKKGIELMVSNLSEHHNFGMIKVQRVVTSSLWMEQHQNKHSHFIYSMSWTNQLFRHHTRIILKGTRDSHQQESSFALKNEMWVNYTHQRSSCSKCQAKSWSLDKHRGFNVLVEARNKKKFSIYVFNNETKEMCNKFFQLTSFRRFQEKILFSSFSAAFEYFHLHTPLESLMNEEVFHPEHQKWRDGEDICATWY